MKKQKDCCTPTNNLPPAVPWVATAICPQSGRWSPNWWAYPWYCSRCSRRTAAGCPDLLCPRQPRWRGGWPAPLWTAWCRRSWLPEGRAPWWWHWRAFSPPGEPSGWGLWNLVEQQILWVHLLLYQLPISLLVCWAYPNDSKIQFLSQVSMQQTPKKRFFGINQTKSNGKSQWTLWKKQ